MFERDFTLDYQRTARIGFDEAIFCHNKNVNQIASILEHLVADGGHALLTRLRPEVAEKLPASLFALLDFDEHSETAYFAIKPVVAKTPLTAIVTAGTSDTPAAREAFRTLQYHSEGALQVNDVGVAGLWRLLDRLAEIRRLPVVIVIAGMDAALPSVIGGLVPGAIIAVPASAGYGMTRHGETALFAALVSCAPGITVVNIDNGFGAACAALRIVRAIRSATVLPLVKHSGTPAKSKIE